MTTVILAYIIGGIFLGIVTGWLIAKSTSSKYAQAATTLLLQDKNAAIADLQSDLKLNRQI